MGLGNDPGPSFLFRPGNHSGPYFLILKPDPYHAWTKETKPFILLRLAAVTGFLRGRDLVSCWTRMCHAGGGQPPPLQQVRAGSYSYTEAGLTR